MPTIITQPAREAHPCLEASARKRADRLAKATNDQMQAALAYLRMVDPEAFEIAFTAVAAPARTRPTTLATPPRLPGASPVRLRKTSSSGHSRVPPVYWRDTVPACGQPVLPLGGLEYGVEVPLQEIRIRPVGSPFRQHDELPGLRIEGLTVAELAAQPRADPEPIGRVDAHVAVVEHHVHVGTEQHAVVEAVLAAVGRLHRQDVRCLQGRADL